MSFENLDGSLENTGPSPMEPEVNIAAIQGKFEDPEIKKIEPTTPDKETPPAVPSKDKKPEMTPGGINAMQGNISEKS